MSQIDIDEIINTLKAENALNNEAFVKATEDINSRLDDLVNEGMTTEFIRSTLQDLEVVLEERYRKNIENYENLKSSFDALNEKQDILVKNSDLRIMFNVLNENIDNFAQEINEQKRLLDEVDSKIVEFRNDNSKKEEILENISIVKSGIDEVNRGLQASIMDVNSSLRGITKTLMTMDVTDQNDIIKRELENIYISTTAILSSLEIADQKNEDLVKNMLVKDDLINLAGKIDNSFALVSEKLENLGGNEHIISEIHKNRDELISFNEKITNGLSNYLDSVRDMLTDCIDGIKKTQADSVFESDSIARQKLENLEKLSDDIKKIDTTISSQSENYVSVINDKINEIAESVKDFKNYSEQINVDFGNQISSKFTDLSNTIEGLKSFSDTNYIQLQEKVDNGIRLLETLANDGNIKLDTSILEISEVKNELNNLVDKISTFELAQDGKIDNFGDKLDENLLVMQNDLKDFFGNFETLKYSIEQANFENRESLSEIADNISDRISAILNNLSETKSTSEKNIFENISELKSQIEELHNTFTTLSAKNLENILMNLEMNIANINSLDVKVSQELENKLAPMKEQIANSSEETKQKIADFQNNFSTVSSQNFEQIINNIQLTEDKISQVGAGLQANIDEKLQAISDKIFATEAENKNQMSEFESKLTSISEYNTGNIISGIETISDRLQTLSSDISAELISKTQAIKDAFNDTQNDKENLLDEVSERLIVSTNAVSEKILSGLEHTSSKIDMLKIDLSTDVDNNFDMVRDFIDYSKIDSQQKSVDLANLSENIKNISIDFANNTESIKSAITEQLSGMQSYIESIKQCAESDGEQEKINKIVEKIMAVETAMHEAGDNFSDSLMMLQNKIEDYQKSLEDISSSSAERISSSLDEISGIKTEVKELVSSILETAGETKDELKEVSESLISKFNEVVLNVTDVKESLDVQVGASLQKNAAVIDEEFSKLRDLLNENNLRNFDGISDLADATTSKIEALKQEVNLISTDVVDALNSKSEAIANEFSPLKESIENFLNSDFDKIVDSIKSQIELSYLNFSADVNDNLTENHDSYVRLEENYQALLDKFSNVESIISDLTQNQIGIMTSSITEVEKNFENNLEKTNSLLQEWKTDLKIIEDKIASSTSTVENNIIAQLTSFIKTTSAANKKEVKEFIEQILEKDTLSKDISEEFSRLKEDLLSLHAKVDVMAMSDNTGAIEDLIGGIEDKIDLLANSDETEKISQLIQSLHDKVDIAILSDDDIKFGEITESLELLNEKFEDFSKSDISKISDMIQSLHDKLDVIVTNDSDEKIENMIQSLHDKLDVVVTDDSEEKIEDMVQALHDKVDVLALSDDSDIVAEIQDIKDLIYAQRKQIEQFSDSSKSENIDKHLQELFSDLSKIEEKLVGLDLEKNASDIKDSVMNAVLAVVDQITFAEETEEIKGFVEERTDEINKNLLDVKKQLNNITNGTDEWDYSYTMQDIESDIAKLRMILNDISAANSKDGIAEISQNMHKIASSINTLHSSLTEEQILELKGTIEKINEDVLSLSSRTNKLLLTSDESYKALTDGLDEFSRLASQLKSRIDTLDNNERNAVIERKLDDINEVVLSSANSNNVIRQVMMYMGEWIDEASQKLETIAEDASNVSIINSEICLLKSMVDNTAVVESIEKKFNDQQNRIEMLERKLDSVLNAIENQNNSQGYLNLEAKLDKLNDKINKLSQGIEKLASYVDEE